MHARGLALAYLFIRMVDPPAALPLAGTVVVVRLKDDLVRPDGCRLVRIGHPARVRMALHGRRDEFLVRGFVVQVWEEWRPREHEKCSTLLPHGRLWSILAMYRRFRALET